ncbi:hypothetical protein, conserved [Eimeria maxima]|uniref:Centrosomal protein CEP104 Zn finger domain-containing protein n=1 Tax=Eimeria maxima TaxID=5804 RepID=U6M405_EIMMA|nr:hypothetical protein, conserved [Eimeria maxima]CDJ57154.1 hypothetical protein, conserved [Eimeria maxima]
MGVSVPAEQRQDKQQQKTQQEQQQQEQPQQQADQPEAAPRKWTSRWRRQTNGPRQQQKQQQQLEQQQQQQPQQQQPQQQQAQDPQKEPQQQQELHHQSSVHENEQQQHLEELQQQQQQQDQHQPQQQRQQQRTAPTTPEEALAFIAAAAAQTQQQQQRSHLLQQCQQQLLQQVQRHGGCSSSNSDQLPKTLPHTVVYTASCPNRKPQRETADELCLGCCNGTCGSRDCCSRDCSSSNRRKGYEVGVALGGVCRILCLQFAAQGPSKVEVPMELKCIRLPQHMHSNFIKIVCVAAPTNEVPPYAVAKTLVRSLRVGGSPAPGVGCLSYKLQIVLDCWEFMLLMQQQRHSQHQQQQQQQQQASGGGALAPGGCRRISAFLLQQLLLLQQAKQQRAQAEMFNSAARIHQALIKVLQALPKVQALEAKKEAAVSRDDFAAAAAAQQQLQSIASLLRRSVAAALVVQSDTDPLNPSDDELSEGELLRCLNQRLPSFETEDRKEELREYPEDAPVPRRAAAIARGAAAAGAAGDSGALAPLLAFWDPETVECICSKSPDKRAEGFAALLQRLQHEEQLRQQQQPNLLPSEQFFGALALGMQRAFEDKTLKVLLIATEMLTSLTDQLAVPTAYFHSPSFMAVLDGVCLGVSGDFSQRMQQMLLRLCLRRNLGGSVSRLIWLGLLQHIVCTYTNSSSNNNSNSSVFQLTGAQLQTLKALTSMGTPESLRRYPADAMAVCMFCLRRSPSLVGSGLDRHFAEFCPCLAICSHCGTVLEVQAQQEQQLP